MNCSECGSPLLFDRVVFRCQCGAYVHAYCADKHIVASHRPSMEEGFADLNGDFHLKHQPVAEVAIIGAAVVGAIGEPAVVGEDDDLVPGEEIVGDVDEELGDQGDETGDDSIDEEK
jgi:hypothetical protein